MLIALQAKPDPILKVVVNHAPVVPTVAQVQKIALPVQVILLVASVPLVAKQDVRSVHMRMDYYVNLVKQANTTINLKLLTVNHVMRENTTERLDHLRYSNA